jgi:type IV pilus assembly protein PilA
MKNRLGFTLVEIMIVVAIIALLAAIAVPNLLRARANANEAAAVAAMKTLTSAAISYRAANFTYPLDLTSMVAAAVSPAYIDDVLGAGAKQGYNFTLAGSTDTFTVTAEPQTSGFTGNRRFFIDESGVMRVNISASATAGSPVFN